MCVPGSEGCPVSSAREGPPLSSRGTVWGKSTGSLQRTPGEPGREAASPGASTPKARHCLGQVTPGTFLLSLSLVHPGGAGVIGGGGGGSGGAAGSAAPGRPGLGEPEV